MNKVKLTQEQARAIERGLELSSREKLVKEHVEYQLQNKKWSVGKLKSFNELSTETVIRALYIGYEVEQEYKVGEWVKSKLGKGVGIIIDVDDSEYYTDFGMIVPKHDDLIRYATDEEIAKEKQRRDEKLDKILLRLTDYERERLTVKLAGGNE